MPNDRVKIDSYVILVLLNRHICSYVYVCMIVSPSAIYPFTVFCLLLLVMDRQKIKTNRLYKVMNKQSLDQQLIQGNRQNFD